MKSICIKRAEVRFGQIRTFSSRLPFVKDEPNDQNQELMEEAVAMQTQQKRLGISGIAIH